MIIKSSLRLVRENLCIPLYTYLCVDVLIHSLQVAFIMKTLLESR